MPTRRLTNRPSGASAPRRAHQTERPEHVPCVLPIHETCSGELRAIYSKHPPVNIHRLLRGAIADLRDASGDFALKRRTLVFEAERERDERTEQKIAKLGKRVEMSVRGLVDLDERSQNMKKVLQEIGEIERNRGNTDGVQPLEEYTQRTRRARRAFKRRDLKDRYGNTAEYIDFRAVVHALTDPSAPQPQKKDWFKKPMFLCDAVAGISDEEPVSESDGDPGPADQDQDIEMIEQEDESDDDIQETSVTRNLKCPLTMVRFQEPVKASCGHVFEQHAILSMFKEYRKLKKPTICPTTGCGKEIKANELREDPVTKSLVQAEIRREQQEEERGMVDTDDEEEGDNELVQVKSKRKSKSRVSEAVKDEEDEIPYGSDEGGGEERVEETDNENPSDDQEEGEDGEDEDEDEDME
ncbi:hypothetical protein ABW20_dc0105402 [Dactylellina cionopaga]|nr:hypothetical protein ABW20_dc0105402 [Dactylellina cionopaga]